MRIYARTLPKYWKRIKGGVKGRVVEPIPYTSGNDEFGVNITEDKLEKLKYVNGDIRFFEVMNWLLPSFGIESFWEWLAAWMRNYKHHIIKTKTGSQYISI